MPKSVTTAVDLITSTRRRYSVSGLLVSVEFCLRSVGLSFCPSVGNDREFWKNGRLDRDAVCGGGSGKTKERCGSRWGPYGEGDVFFLKGGVHWSL